MAEFYMMIGIAGSGKSYEAEKIAEMNNAKIVSSDAIRAELFGSEEDQSHNAEVFEEVHRRIHNHLANGESCIYDATNLSRKRRIGFLKQLPKGVKKIAVLVATELEVILNQNKQRDRHVPTDVILRMYKNIQVPIITEGWDDILIKVNSNNSKALKDYLMESRGISHDNPHHTASIFNHMLLAEDYVKKNAWRAGLHPDDEKLAIKAALYHDIGKPICKTYTLWSGKKDTHARYYNHAEVGAYMVACSLNGAADLEEYEMLMKMMIIIRWHMSAFEDKEHYMDKFEAAYGKNLAKIFALVHEADLSAH